MITQNTKIILEWMIEYDVDIAIVGQSILILKFFYKLFLRDGIIFLFEDVVYTSV